MESNDIITIELHNLWQHPFAVPTARILGLETAFCDLVKVLSSEPADKKKKSKRQERYSLELALLDARQGSLKLRFKAVLLDLHTRRNDVAIYATILALPVALFQLSGVGSPVSPQGADDDYKKALEIVRGRLEDVEVQLAQERFERAMERTRSHEVIVVVPGAPAMSLNAFDPRPEDGKLYEFVWHVPAYEAAEIEAAIWKIAGVTHISKKIAAGRSNVEHVLLFVQIDTNLSTQEVHRCQRQIVESIKVVRAARVT